MVNFVFEPTVAEDHECNLNLKNLKEQSLTEHFDTKFQDFSLADSFLDFDSIDWFEEKLAQEMDGSYSSNLGVCKEPVGSTKDGIDERIQEQSITDDSQVNVGESVSVVKMEGNESEKLESLCFNIVQEMSEVSLVGANASSVAVDGEGEKDKRMDDEDGQNSEHVSHSQASSSSTSDSSGSGKDEDKNDDNDDDEEEEEEDGNEGKEKHEVVDSGTERKSEDVDVEFEEGEIRDSEPYEDKMVSWTGSDDDDDESNSGKEDDGVKDEINANNDDVERVRIQSKNELKMLPPVAPVDVMLQPHHQMVPVGVILSVVSTQVIVEATEKHNPLNEGSVLWLTNSRLPLGRVDEIFGPVKLPYYIVRYNCEGEIPACVKEGTAVSFVPNFVHHVLNEKDLYKKGYDASGENDEEVSDDGEFSDDEKEEQFKNSRKLSKRSVVSVRDHRPENKKNNKMKVVRDRNLKQHQTLPHKDGASLRNQGQDTSLPVPSVSSGKVASFSAPGHGLPRGTALPQQFPPTNVDLNHHPNGFSANGMPPHQLSQNAVLPNRFPTDGTQLYSNQMPVTGMQFNQQVNPFQNLVSAVISTLNQQNSCPGSMYQQGLVGQNQTNFGMGLPVASSRPLMNSQGIVGQNQMNFGTGLPVVSSHPFMNGGGQGLIPYVGLLGQNQMTHFEAGFLSSRPAMYPQGLVGQNQMNYGTGLPSSQPLINGGQSPMNFQAGFQSFHPHMNAEQQGVISNGRLVGQNQMNLEAGFQGSHSLNDGGGQRIGYNTSAVEQGMASNALQFEKENNLQANALGNRQRPPQQFNMGTSTGQQRKSFQRRGGHSAGRRGWRNQNRNH